MNKSDKRFHKLEKRARKMGMVLGLYLTYRKDINGVDLDDLPIGGEINFAPMVKSSYQDTPLSSTLDIIQTRLDREQAAIEKQAAFSAVIDRIFDALAEAKVKDATQNAPEEPTTAPEQPEEGLPE